MPRAVRRDNTGEDEVSYTTIDEARATLEELNARYDGELPEDAQVTWDSAEQFIKRGEESVANLRRVATRGGASFDEPARRSKHRDGNAVGECLRAIEAAPYCSDHIREGAAHAIEHGHHDAVGREYLRAVSDPNYLTAYYKVMGDSVRGHLEFTPQEGEAWRRTMTATRAMSVGNDSGGGYAVPFQLDPSFINEGVGSIDNLRKISRVETTLGSQKRFLTVNQIDVDYDAEAEEVDDDSPSLGPVDVPIYRATAYVVASFEAFDDIASLTRELSVLFADARQNLESEKFVNGNGTTEPHGLLRALNKDGGSLEFGGSPSIAAEDVYAVLEALPPRWRGQAQWLSNLRGINELDQLETTNGSKKFPSLDNAQPQLLRRNISEHSQIVGSDQLVVGDFKQFVIVDHAGTGRTELVQHVFGPSANRPTGERGVLFWWRNGSEVLVPDAFRVLSSGSS